MVEQRAFLDSLSCCQRAQLETDTDPAQATYFAQSLDVCYSMFRLSTRLYI